MATTELGILPTAISKAGIGAKNTQSRDPRSTTAVDDLSGLPMFIDADIDAYDDADIDADIDMDNDADDEGTDEDELYPSSDGMPMGETSLHVDLTMETIAALRLYFQDRDDVLIAGNNFIYYVEGDPTSVVSPDTYVVFGVAPSPLRDIYQVWAEGGHTPSVIFEFTSKSTRRADRHRKFNLYEQVLKVDEYFLFDPTLTRRARRLRGYRLVDGKYVELEHKPLGMYSSALNLNLVPDDKKLRMYDADSGKRLPTLIESAAETILERELADEARALAKAAAARADEADARANAKSALLDAEAARANAADAHAKLEAARADALEAELARVRGLLCE